MRPPTWMNNMTLPKNVPSPPWPLATKNPTFAKWVLGVAQPCPPYPPWPWPQIGPSNLASKVKHPFPVFGNEVDLNAHVKAFTIIAKAKNIINDKDQKCIASTTLHGTGIDR